MVMERFIFIDCIKVFEEKIHEAKNLFKRLVARVDR